MGETHWNETDWNETDWNETDWNETDWNETDWDLNGMRLPSYAPFARRREGRRRRGTFRTASGG